MTDFAGRLDRALRAAGVAIDGVSIGNHANKATWTVQPSELQGAAQPIIDAFDPDDPLHAQADAERRALKQRDLDMPLIRALLDHLPTLATDITAGTYDAGEAENRIFQTIRTYRRGLKQE